MFICPVGFAFNKGFGIVKLFNGAVILRRKINQQVVKAGDEEEKKKQQAAENYLTACILQFLAAPQPFIGNANQEKQIMPTRKKRIKVLKTKLSATDFRCTNTKTLDITAVMPNRINANTRKTRRSSSFFFMVIPVTRCFSNRQRCICVFYRNSTSHLFSLTEGNCVLKISV